MAAGTLASLLIDLTVNSAGLREGLDSAKKTVGDFGKAVTATLEGVQQMGKSIKRAANEVAQAGLGLAAVASGAVALAATVDKGIAAEVKNLKTAFQDLAVPIAQMVVPAMRELAGWVRSAADFVAGLSPQTKQMIANFVQVAAVVGGAALVISKVAGAISALAGVLAAITAGPFLAVIAGMAVIAAGALFLHKVWRENWGGIQDVAREVVTAITGYWSAFKAWFNTFLDGLIDKWAVVEKAIARVGNAIKAATPGSGFGLEDLSKMNRNSDARIDQWAESMKGGGLAQAALDLAKRIKGGLVDAAGALKAELDLILGKFSVGLGHATRHGIEAGSAKSSGMDAIADLSMQAAQVKIDMAAGKLAESIKVNNDFLNRGLRIATQDRIGMENSATGRIRAALEQVGAALARTGMAIASKMGDVGAIIGSAAQGFSSGGPWGAIIAVIGELLSRLEVFTKFSDMLNAKLFKSLGELNTAIAPLFDMIGQFSEMLNPIRQIIHSIISFVLGVLKPIFEVVGAIFKGLGEVLTPIADALGAVFDAILAITDSFNLLDGIVYTTGLSFKAIGVVIGFAMAGIMTTALGVIRLVQEILKAVGANYSGIKKTGDDLEDKIKAMQKSWGEGWDKYDPTKYDPNASSKIEDATKPVVKLGEAAEKVARTFEEMNLNLPEGYKIAAARFGADGADPSSTKPSKGKGGSSSAPVPARDYNAEYEGALGGARNAFDFSSVSFDVGDLLQGADYTGTFENGSMTGKGSTDTGGDGGTFVPTGSGGGWTQQQMIAFMNAFQAALDAGATEDQAVQAGTMAANAVGQGGGGGGGGAGGGGGGGGGGEEASAGAGGAAHGGVHFYGPVNLAPANFEEFIGKIGEAETRSSSRKRRNPSRAK